MRRECGGKNSWTTLTHPAMLPVLALLLEAARMLAAARCGGSGQAAAAAVAAATSGCLRAMLPLLPLHHRDVHAVCCLLGCAAAKRRRLRKRTRVAVTAWARMLPDRCEPWQGSGRLCW